MSVPTSLQQAASDADGGHVHWRPTVPGLLFDLSHRLGQLVSRSPLSPSPCPSSSPGFAIPHPCNPSFTGWLCCGCSVSACRRPPFQQDADDNSQAALQAARSETLSGTMPATPLPVRSLTHLKRRKLKCSGGTACVYVLGISGRGQSPVYKCDGLDGIAAKGQGRQSMKPGQNGTSTDRADVMGSLLDTSRRPAGIGPRSLTDMSGAWW